MANMHAEHGHSAHASAHGDASHNGHGAAQRDWIEIRILRQDGPGQPSYWERHRVRYEPELNVIGVLQRIATNAKTVDGAAVAPVAWDCNCLEEVCGACTMVINGRVRQSCSALVDRLLDDNPNEIELQPMSKFPVIRDLVVDRGRMFRALEKIQGWIPVDNYDDMGPGPKQSRKAQEERYPLSECMSCGCCLEACPQYTRIDVTRMDGESEEQFQQRRKQAYDRGFVGAHAISQVMLFNSHPTGKNNAHERLDALMEEGGLQVCGNAQNCVAVCPKKIPLTTSIGRAGRATTVHGLKKFFGG
jgi:succinate dehydrogenase / fumarate reductase, iron-sulfur subunit